MTRSLQTGGLRPLVPFAALSASYFAHIGFFNPYLPLWLKAQGMSIVIIGVLTSIQSLTRVFAPYAWGALSDHTGERVKLLRISAAVAFVVSLGLWWTGNVWWVGIVLLLLFTHTSSMMSLTEAAVAHLVAGDWGRYGRLRLWGSAGFMATVLAAGISFEHSGIDGFPVWAMLTLLLVVLCTWWLPNLKEEGSREHAHTEPIGKVLRIPAVRWLFASVFFHIMSQFAVYGFLSLYMDALGYSKTMIGAMWAFSVVVEIGWFFTQGRWVNRLAMPKWLVVCGAAIALRMALTAGLGSWLVALLIAQALHALTFAAHHTACMALVSRYFPARLRARGQALFTGFGYGIGGTLGVLVSSALASRFGFASVFWLAAVFGIAATACALRVQAASRHT